MTLVSTEVSREEFYKLIGPLDVIIDVSGTDTKFRLRHSREVVGFIIDQKFEDEDQYFLYKQKAQLTIFNG